MSLIWIAIKRPWQRGQRMTSPMGSFYNTLLKVPFQISDAYMESE
jgi:hypothetical protein